MAKHMGPSDKEMRRYRAEDMVMGAMKKSARFKKQVEAIMADMMEMEKRAMDGMMPKGKRK